MVFRFVVCRSHGPCEAHAHTQTLKVPEIPSPHLENPFFLSLKHALAIFGKARLTHFHFPHLPGLAGKNGDLHCSTHVYDKLPWQCASVLKRNVQSMLGCMPLTSERSFQTSVNSIFFCITSFASIFVYWIPLVLC